jgi:hypothetical protein
MPLDPGVIDRRIPGLVEDDVAAIVGRHLQHLLEVEVRLGRDARDGRARRPGLLRRLSVQPQRSNLRLSDIEPRFVCAACGKRGAEVRPDFNWSSSIVPAMMGYRNTD